MVDKIIKSINPHDIDISKMSREDFLKMIIKLNKLLRVLDDKEEVLEEDMKAGDLVSPTREVQDRLLEYLVSNLSKIEDKKARAAATYYTLINLHMFSDGNGRTSRFMYDLISGDISEENAVFYFHTDSNMVQEQRNDFERNRKIVDVGEVNKLPDILLKKHFDFVPEYVFDNYDWITVGYTFRSPSTDKIIPPKVLEELTKKELFDLGKILKDGYGVLLCPSGLAMLYVSQKKGELGNWWQKNESDLKNGIGVPYRLNFSIYKNPNMIAHWTAEDFRELIRVGNDIKFDRLKAIIDVFLTPEKYIHPSTGKPYSDEILGYVEEEKKTMI